jgi:hypothetical protein
MTDKILRKLYDSFMDNYWYDKIYLNDKSAELLDYNFTNEDGEYFCNFSYHTDECDGTEYDSCSVNLNNRILV